MTPTAADGEVSIRKTTPTTEAGKRLLDTLAWSYAPGLTDSIAAIEAEAYEVGYRDGANDRDADLVTDEDDEEAMPNEAEAVNAALDRVAAEVKDMETCSPTVFAVLDAIEEARPKP